MERGSTMTIVICDRCGLSFLSISIWRRYHVLTFDLKDKHYPRSEGGDCGYWELPALIRNKFKIDYGTS